MGRRKIEDRPGSKLVEDVIAGELSAAELATKYDCTTATIRKAIKRIREAEADGVLGIDTTPVVVVFRLHMGNDPASITVDALNSYEGLRVYNRGALDPRITMGREEPLPHFDTFHAAGLYLGEEPGGFRPCTLAYEAARGVFQGSDFADFRRVADKPL